MKIDEDIRKREVQAEKLIRDFGIDNLNTEELSDLEYAIHCIQSKKKKEDDRKKILELKERYEGKYFDVDGDGVYFIKEVINEYICDCVYFSYMSNSMGRSRLIFGQDNLSDLMSPKISMTGNILDGSKLEKAKELSKDEVVEWIKKKFSEICIELEVPCLF